jgi:hypothetical protein
LPSLQKNLPRRKSAPDENVRARLSLDLDVATKENFEALVERTRVGSLTELIKKSVSLFDVATAHTSKGGVLIFRHVDGREERIVLL